MYYKNIKEIWEENTCPCCLYKKLYFEAVEIGFIYFHILFFTCLYIICIFHIFLIIIALVTYLNELRYTIISLTIMLSWTSFFSPANSFLEMNPQERGDWGKVNEHSYGSWLLLPNCFPKGLCWFTRTRQSISFQGLFLKLLKRNKILYGARGPDNV